VCCCLWWSWELIAELFVMCVVCSMSVHLELSIVVRVERRRAHVVGLSEEFCRVCSLYESWKGGRLHSVTNRQNHTCRLLYLDIYFIRALYKIYIL